VLTPDDDGGLREARQPIFDSVAQCRTRRSEQPADAGLRIVPGGDRKE